MAYKKCSHVSKNADDPCLQSILLSLLCIGYATEPFHYGSLFQDTCGHDLTIPMPGHAIGNSGEFVLWVKTKSISCSKYKLLVSIDRIG